MISSIMSFEAEIKYYIPIIFKKCSSLLVERLVYLFTTFIENGIKNQCHF